MTNLMQILCIFKVNQIVLINKTIITVFNINYKNLIFFIRKGNLLLVKTEF